MNSQMRYCLLIKKNEFLINVKFGWISRDSLLTKKLHKVTYSDFFFLHNILEIKTFIEPGNKFMFSDWQNVS